MMTSKLSFAEIPIVHERPIWLKACTKPLREISYSTNDSEAGMQSLLQHFAKRGAIPDVYCRLDGVIYMGAQ